MLEILKAVRDELTGSGVENVYLAFDAAPVPSKGSIFTVVGAKGFEASAPVYSQYTVFIPFRAELEIMVTAPEYSTMEEVYDYFEKRILPVIDGMSGLSSRLCRLTVKRDTNIRRLVLTAGISAGGIRRTEREEV